MPLEIPWLDKGSRRSNSLQLFLLCSGISFAPKGVITKVLFRGTCLVMLFVRFLSRSCAEGRHPSCCRFGCRRLPSVSRLPVVTCGFLPMPSVVLVVF